MEVDIFIPCFVDQFYPETGFNMLRLLEKLGVEVHYCNKQTCCGQVAYNAGFWDEAKAIGEKFIRNYSNNRLVVTPSTSCAGMVRNNFNELFYNSALHIEYKQLQKNIIEFTDFLVNVLQVTDVGAVFNHVVVYHDSCASLREYILGDEPRALLRYVRGLELREMERRTECCGFGGAFSVKHEAISTAMAQQKVDDAIATGAEYIISTDSSCLLHLDGYIKKHKLPIKTAHIADVLATGC